MVCGLIWIEGYVSVRERVYMCVVVRTQECKREVLCV